MAEIGIMKKLTIGGSTYTIPEYNLPIASASVLGGVKIGTGLSINSTTGVLSATGLDYDEADPIFVASPAYGIGDEDISNWNSKTSNTGTITKVQTSAGTHTTVNVSSGNVSFNVPTKTSHLTNDSGFLTSSDLASVLTYKGTKASVADVIAISNPKKGDVWHVTADGSEYAWDGTTWQELGTAVDLSGYALSSEIPTTAQNATTGITIADHSTTTVYGVTSSTTSVRGVKTGTSSTTTASHVKSGGNGTAPTLGTAISLTGVQATTTSVRGVKTGTNSLATASHVTSGGNGSTPTLGTAITVRGVKTGTNSTTTASKVTTGTSTSLFGVSSSTTTASKVTTGTSTTLFGVSSSTTTASKVTTGSHSTDYGVSDAGSGSFTQGAFNGGSFSATVTNHVLSYSFTAATHGADSHTHNAPTLGDKVPTVSASDVTVPIKSTGVPTVSASNVTVPIKSTGITTVSASDVTVPIRADADTSIPNVTSVGSASTWAFSDVDVPIRADSDTTVPIKNTTATSIPNVTSAGSASTWSFTDVTVPIRADADTTVPIKDSGTTVVTSKTHSITDNGHTHTLD